MIHRAPIVGGSIWSDRERADARRPRVPTTWLGAMLVVVASVVRAAPPIVEVARGGRLGAPNFFSLALDPAGNIFVGGANSSNVLRIAPRGDRSGSGGDAPCVAEILSKSSVPFSFDGPKGIAIASDGAVYVTGTGGAPNMNDDVVKITADGTVSELVNRTQLGLTDWNPAGIAIDEGGGTFVYATGPAPGQGAVVRIAPDLAFQKVLSKGGQGLVADEDGTVYVARVGEGVYQIPDARTGVCEIDGKHCPLFLKGGDLGCDGQPIVLDGPYALALAGGVLYVTGQNSQNVLRRPLRADNGLALPVCTDQIFLTGDDGLSLDTPRALAADASGNVYVAGNRSDNVIWIKTDPADPKTVTHQEIINRDREFAAPTAVALDSRGDVYVSGNLTSNVFRIRTATAGLTCGNGMLDPGEACDYRLDCCCSVACQVQSAGGICRDSAGECDMDDVCDGTHAVCDDQRQIGTVCRSTAGACDVEETCDGGIVCPDDRFQDAGSVCRSAAGVCDIAESCTGTGPDCPPDQLLPRDTVCREAVNSCDLVERCDGVSALCPQDEDCTRCSTDADCVVTDNCQEARCQQNKCVQSEKVGFALATCGFDDPFPGDELSTQTPRSCGTFMPSGTSACAPKGRLNKAQALCGVSKLEIRAKTMLEHDACKAGTATPDAHVIRRIRHLLKVGIIRANNLRAGRARIDDDCSGALVERFQRLKTNVESGWSCPTTS